MAIQHIILFYRYHPLTEDAAVIEIYRTALEQLCRSLSLWGRILVGASKTEGINGTLAGNDRECVRAFTWALLQDKESVEGLPSPKQNAVREFWSRSSSFFASIEEIELRMNSPEDFKWSISNGTDQLFPDLRVVVRKELIGTGNSDLSKISLEETAQGYLTPEEWHQRLQEASQDESTVVIDCRNTKEFEIGHFQGALDPETTTYSHFPTWVKHNKALLANKNVLMYCTGGIRCEKASAYIRKTVPEVAQVNHLKGGVHKYLEAYGAEPDSLWQGKNFVFDGRQAVSAEETQLGKNGNADSVPESGRGSSEIIGKCVYCESPYDEFVPKCVCAVCREPLLACIRCQKRAEFHCHQHFHLRECFFMNLGQFSSQALQVQLIQLEKFHSDIAVGRKFKAKRRTLVKQCLRVQTRLKELLEAASHPVNASQGTCRNCGLVDCEGKCWGFFSLKRKEVLDAEASKRDSVQRPNSLPLDRSSFVFPIGKRKRLHNEQEIAEIGQSGIFQPPSVFLDNETGIRVPPCFRRTLRCHTKGKWCGRLVAEVVQEEFKELSHVERFQQSLRYGLLRLNNKPMDVVSVAQTRLRSSDVLSRDLHWHEAPVFAPEEIGIRKVALPTALVESSDLKSCDAFVYVCDKPSSVPVHPAGPYFANTLTFMVEAQTGLPPRSLNPVHRTDRVTSGLTLCCTNPMVARYFHTALSEGAVRKMYVARVKGRFPSSVEEFANSNPGITWLEEVAAVEVNAPVWTCDPANGIRTISANGKASRSRFRLVEYDASTNTSIVVCCPLTGRNHQLRLHLSWIGFPIMHDIQYGGEPPRIRQQK